MSASIANGGPPSLVPDGITEVYPHALSFLPLTDIARLGLVSKEWRDASNHALPSDVKAFFARRKHLLSLVDSKLKQESSRDKPTAKDDSAINETLSEMSIKAMKTELESSGIRTAGMEKKELIEALKTHMLQPEVDDDRDTNAPLIDANKKRANVICKTITRLFLDAAQNPRLRMKPCDGAPEEMSDEDKDYYFRTFYAIATQYEELGWIIDDTVHRINWNPQTGARFINHEMLNRAKYSLLTNVEAFFPRLNQFGVAMLLKEAKKDIHLKKVSPFSFFNDDNSEGPDALDTLLSLMQRKAPKEEQKEARAFFFTLHKKLITYLLELRADSAKISDAEKDNHGQTMADKITGIIGLAAFLLHVFEEYANDPKLETFGIFPTDPEDESEEAMMHFVNVSKASMDLKILATFTLKGKHHDKILSFVNRLDLVFNFSFPFLSDASKRATHDAIFEETTNEMKGKKVFKMCSLRTDENGKLIPRGKHSAEE